jgi:hypothetical protein
VTFLRDLVLAMARDVAAVVARKVDAHFARRAMRHAYTDSDGTVTDLEAEAKLVERYGETAVRLIHEREHER